MKSLKADTASISIRVELTERPVVKNRHVDIIAKAIAPAAKKVKLEAAV